VQTAFVAFYVISVVNQLPNLGSSRVPNPKSVSKTLKTTVIVQNQLICLLLVKHTCLKQLTREVAAARVVKIPAPLACYWLGLLEVEAADKP
jgi:hypothetical protein